MKTLTKDEKKLVKRAHEFHQRLMRERIENEQSFSKILKEVRAAGVSRHLANEEGWDYTTMLDYQIVPEHYESAAKGEGGWTTQTRLAAQLGIHVTRIHQLAVARDEGLPVEPRIAFGYWKHKFGHAFRLVDNE